MRLNRVLLAAAVLGTAAASCPAVACGEGSGDAPPPAAPADAPAVNPAVTPGPTQASSSKRSPMDEWRWWWTFNQDAIIAALRSNSPPTPRVSDEVVRTKLVPRLRALLADDENLHVRSCAALALGRAGDAESAPLLRAMAASQDVSLHRQIVESAVLALGLLQHPDPETRALLAEIVRRPDARKTFARPFAAVALGLLGEQGDPDRTSVRVLLDVARSETDDVSVRPASLLALGLLEDESAVPELTEFASRGCPTEPGASPYGDVERAFAIEALARIASPANDVATLRLVTSVVERRREVPSVPVRRAATVALALIAARCDASEQVRAAEILCTLADDDGAGVFERRIALIALGRLAAAPGADPRTRSGILAYLRSSVDRSRPGNAAFAAIALAFVGRAELDETGGLSDTGLRTPLRLRFLGEPDPALRCAYALASGIVEDPAASAPLLAVLEDPAADKRLRGSSALALGMIGDADSRECVRTTLLTECDRDLRSQCAASLDLLGDSRCIDDLLAVLRHPDASNYERGTSALALGSAGDDRAVVPLLEVAASRDQYPDLTRALCVVALGHLADRNDASLQARIGSDVNYRASVPAITELLTIL